MADFMATINRVDGTSINLDMNSIIHGTFNDERNKLYWWNEKDDSVCSIWIDPKTNTIESNLYV